LLTVRKYYQSNKLGIDMDHYETSRWDLTDLFPSYDSQEMKVAFEAVKGKIEELEGRRSSLDAQMDVQEFFDFVREYEKNSRVSAQIAQYAALWFSEDTQNQDAQAFDAKVQQFMTELQNKIIFMQLWWKSLSDEEAARFLEQAGEFKYWLNQIRKYKPYTLTEPEEKIINLKDVTGESAFKRLYSTITNRYVFTVEVDGETKKLDRGELMALVQGNDANLRARAYQELYRVYGEDGPILGQIYQSLVRDFNNENKNLRGYMTSISWRNLGNDIPDEVVDTLLDVAQQNVTIFQRYFKLKANWLKIPKLKRYDIYAPVTSSDKEYDFNFAVNLVEDTFREFSPRIADLAQRVFKENHIDSEVRANKRSGAFCSYYDPDLTPYVLVNYNKQFMDVNTLAHELGHAIHGMLSSHHNVFNFHPSLPLAETASTFAEMLLTDKVLSEETDENIKLDILFSQVADSYATIMRQIYFALFERKAHSLIMEDASVDDLSSAYMKNLQDQFGDSLELSDEFKWEWVSIPHIYHYPFYVYAYSFGQLLVLALYKQYKTEGESFKARFLEILSAGRSASPIDILAKAGIDIRLASFWQGGFDVIKEMIEKLEEIPVR
jgi:oligoendopeptidase F